MATFCYGLRVTHARRCPLAYAARDISDPIEALVVDKVDARGSALRHRSSLFLCGKIEDPSGHPMERLRRVGLAPLSPILLQSVICGAHRWCRLTIGSSVSRRLGLSRPQVGLTPSQTRCVVVRCFILAVTNGPVWCAIRHPWHM